MLRSDPPMLRPNSADRGDMLADAAFHLLLSGGPAALTVRGLARWLQASTGTVTGWVPQRADMVRIIVRRLGDRWLELAYRRRSLGPLCLLPRTEEEVAACRVWLAIEELGRSEASVSAVVASVRNEERRLVAGFVGGDADGADTLFCLVSGLRGAVCGQTPMSADRARQILDRYLRRNPGPTVLNQAPS